MLKQCEKCLKNTLCNKIMLLVLKDRDISCLGPQTNKFWSSNFVKCYF